MLIVMRGLPGSGKSTIADELGRRLRAPVLSVDPIEAAIWRAGITPAFETGLAAYEVAAAVAGEQLRLGHDVVVDAVNAIAVIRPTWVETARRADVAMTVIEVQCSDADLHRRRLASRTRHIDGFPEPTWDEVVARREEWEEWPDPALRLDSAEPSERNVELALQHLAQLRPA